MVALKDSREKTPAIADAKSEESSSKKQVSGEDNRDQGLGFWSLQYFVVVLGGRGELIIHAGYIHRPEILTAAPSYGRSA